MKIKTRKITCKTYKGTDLVEARRDVCLTQLKFASKCFLSVHKYQQYEHNRFVIIPLGFKPITEAEFDIMQKALR